MAESINIIESKNTKTRIIPAAAIIFALFFGWFAVTRQLGNMLAELTPPSASNAKQIADAAVGFAPRDPLANWFAASVGKNVFTLERTESAVKLSENVVRLAPFDFRWWIELGRAYENAEKYEQAENALRRAVELAPNYVYPRWQLGNFYLRRNRSDEAFAELKKVTAGNIAYRDQVYSIAWDYFDLDTGKVEEIAGNSPENKLSLVKFYAVKERAADSLRIWNSLSEEEKRLDPGFAKVVAQALYEKRFYRSAIEFARQTGIDPEAKAETITNGSFEKPIGDPRETYFGWKISPAEKLEIKTDTTQKKEGARSLRVVFTGYSGTNFNHVWQAAAIESKKKYRLSFWLKTENLKSAGTPTLEIVNAGDDKIITASKPFPTGTNDWQEINLEFTMPENSEGFFLRTARAYCGDVCPIAGTFWIDDFRIGEQ
ncbi:MAG: carbohydrate binding domain-containing protein [Pyrinomonadaceae bacterium]|nr:carbohydrate binding domain-containing protein [Pyrinomonadaceae bacterium]